MRNLLVPFALVLSLLSTPACTFAGAAVGAGIADRDNEELRARGEDPERSVAAHALGGAVLGIAIDVLLLSLAASALTPPPENETEQCWIGCGGY